MELYIQIKDGVPYQHPIHGDNIREAWPHIDLNNLPPTLAKFTRVPEPRVGVFEVLLGCSYEWDGDTVKDVWTKRPMTFEEELGARAKIEDICAKDLISAKNLAQEKFDQALPEDKHVWQEYINALNSWTLIDYDNPGIPGYPIKFPDGKWYSTYSSGSAPNVIS